LEESALVKLDIKQNTYYDSVTLMLISKDLKKLDGVEEALVGMGTDLNRDIAHNLGLVTPEFETITANDFFVAIRCENDDVMSAALAKVDELLTKKKENSSANYYPPTLSSAIKMDDQLNLAIISVPGKYAAGVADECLDHDINVMLFSDNVTIEEEKRLKEKAVSKELLMMGPDCGTAIINNVPLAFANVIRPGDIGIVGACSYQPDKQALLTRPSALSLSDDGPAVLIVHTHSSEAYTMEAGFEYPESDALRTLDERYSVIRVGDEIADILTEAGISVLHDTQPNDYPNYNGAYERMRQTIEGYLAEYPSIQMVLDIHRDAAEDADGNPVALTAEADGEACAELMLVVGTDEGGLSHPDWQENLANALKIQTLLNRSAPGLCRNLNLRTERFNQHETPGSLLVEVGASGNTLAEALRSARILGQALAVFLRGQMHDDTD